MGRPGLVGQMGDAGVEGVEVGDLAADRVHDEGIRVSRSGGDVV